MEIQETESDTYGFTIAMVIMCIAFLFAYLSFAGGATGFGAFFAVLGFIALVAGMIIKSKKNDT